MASAAVRSDHRTYDSIHLLQFAFLLAIYVWLKRVDMGNVPAGRRCR